jgi:hypothetical protein
MSTDKEFFDLLNSITEEQTFSFELISADKPTKITCKPLTTFQLKELVKSAVDSPLTQAAFNSAVSTIFVDSITENPGIKFNIIDRLLFVLETRLNSFSSTKEVEHEGKKITIDFKSILTKLRKELKSNIKNITPSSVTEGKFTVHFGVPYVATELQMNEELYKNFDINIEDAEKLRKIIGEAFINEIAKTIDAVIVSKDGETQKVMDLSTVSFKQRLKVVESLPASLIQSIIEYVENYKEIIENCLIVDGYSVPIDSTLFTIK